MTRQKVIISIFSSTVLVLYLLKIFLVADTAVSSIELAELENLIKRLKQENIHIQQQILIETSLKTISEKAEKEGFVEGRYIYL